MSVLNDNDTLYGKAEKMELGRIKYQDRRSFLSEQNDVHERPGSMQV